MFGAEVSPREVGAGVSWSSIGPGVSRHKRIKWGSKLVLDLVQLYIIYTGAEYSISVQIGARGLGPYAIGSERALVVYVWGRMEVVAPVFDSNLDSNFECF